MTESEPGFVIDYLRAMSPAVEEMVVGHLGAELAGAAPVVSGTLSIDQVVDVLMRLLASSWRLAGAGPAHTSEVTMEWLLQPPTSAG